MRSDHVGSESDPYFIEQYIGRLSDMMKRSHPVEPYWQMPSQIILQSIWFARFRLHSYFSGRWSWNSPPIRCFGLMGTGWPASLVLWLVWPSLWTWFNLEDVRGWSMGPFQCSMPFESHPGVKGRAGRSRSNVACLLRAASFLGVWCPWHYPL